MRMGKRKMYRRLLAVFLILLLCLSMGMSAAATGTKKQDNDEKSEEELTPEELEKRELKKVYKMPVQTNELKNWPKGPGTYGEAAIVMEVGTGSILYAKNIDEHEYPASITKVLTALVALENGELTDPVQFSNDCVSFLQPGDSMIGLKEGDEITLEQALYATLLASANEGAYAVGENVGKNAGHDYNWFVEQMNQRCKELGGENSHFANTNGLHDPEHYTCARDMALIGRELFHHPEFFKIVQTLQYEIPKSKTCEEHIFQQKHKMLRPENENYYEYAVGGKTGYTSDALSTLITMADNGETKLVCVVLRTHGRNVYPDTTKLFEYGFNKFTKVDVAGQEKSEDVGEILTDDESGYVMLPEGIEFSDLDMEMTLQDGNTKEALLTYTYEGNLVGTARANVSEKYMEKHKAKISKTGSKDDEKENVIEKIKGKSKKELAVLAALIVLLFILVIALIGQMKKIARKRKRRNRRI